MAQKKKPPLTPKTTKQKKKQPLTVDIELQQHQEELGLINRELALSQVELEAAYRQYTDLYDFAPVGYITLARNGAIQQVNLAMANMLGINHDEVTRLRLAAFVSSESRPTFDVFFEKLLSGEGKETCEVVLEKKGQALVWARLEATCFESGNVCRAMLTDITERKRMEQILQESEKSLPHFVTGCFHDSGPGICNRWHNTVLEHCIRTALWIQRRRSPRAKFTGLDHSAGNAK